MTPEEKKELEEYIDEKFPPNSLFWSRLYDDDCICPDIDTFNPNCPNKRCQVTGTPRPSVYCNICKKEYIDFCIEHHGITNSWELRYERQD